MSRLNLFSVSLLATVFLLSLTGVSSSFADPTHSSMRSSTNAINRAVKTSVRQALPRKGEENYRTTANLNMRDQANSRAKVIRTLKRGASVKPLEEKSGVWWKVSTGKDQGWVHSKYLKK